MERRKLITLVAALIFLIATGVFSFLVKSGRIEGGSETDVTVPVIVAVSLMLLSAIYSRKKEDEE